MLKVSKKAELPYIEAKNVTRNGTEKSTSTPWKMEIKTSSFPLTAVITGKVESIEVAPPEAIGANFPKNLHSSGANSSVITSLIIFDIRAIVPNCAAISHPIVASLIWVISTEERE